MKLMLKLTFLYRCFINDRIISPIMKNTNLKSLTKKSKYEFN